MLSPLDELQLLAVKAKRITQSFDVTAISGADAVVLLRLFSEIADIGAAGKSLCARRVEEANAFMSSGHRDAAALAASVSGVSLGEALRKLDTARKLTTLPEVDAAFRSGSLSSQQAALVARGVSVSPGAQDGLLQSASQESAVVLVWSSGIKDVARLVAEASSDSRKITEILTDKEEKLA